MYFNTYCITYAAISDKHDVSMLNHFHHRIHSYRIKLECNDLSMINQSIIAYDFKNSSAKSVLKGCSGSGSFTNAIKAWITVNELTLVRFCSWFPVFRTYNWQTYLTLFVYIRMIYLCFEIYSWWFKGVFCGKIDFDAKCAFVIRGTRRITESHEDSRTCTLHPHDGYLEFTFCSLLVAAILKINSTKSSKTCSVRRQCASPADSSDKFPRAQDLGG
ncbi:hypothetical protein ALC56_12436 [Trachymyrmex septentrionalis]|uniref:Uncharacterized protein n=1 Tax=Trachymyrmex septentrionalis TaxID=34720 RepID=A0A195EZF0_9HYME|nr:hypothetical protein ALC56_12436 [Trachymyrmex septentrionalis]